MRRLNVKLLFGLVLGAVLLLAVTGAVHWLQTGRIARALRDRADRAEQQGNPEQVIRFLSRYLEMAPEDIDARARLGERLTDNPAAMSPRSRARAVFLLEQVLAKKPDRHDLRLRLARTALDLDRRDLAREHLTYLTTVRPDDGAAAFLFGKLAETESQWDKAAGWYKHAVKNAPQQMDAYVRLADVLRRRLAPLTKDDLALAADQVMDNLVASNPEAFQAYLARWRYQREWFNRADQDQLEKAAGNVRRALELAPDNADVLLAGAELAQAKKDSQQARVYLDKAQQLHPQDARVYRELAWLELRRDKPATDQAIAELRKGTAVLKGPARYELLWMLANVLIDCKQSDEAAKVIADMGKTGATAAALDYLQARLSIINEKWSEAVRLLERSRELFATTPELANQADSFLAQCYEKLNNTEARLAALGRMVSRDPSSVRALLERAAALTAQGQFDEALVQYQQALKLPDAPAAVRVEIARLLVLRNLLLPAPDWKPVEEALGLAAQQNKDAADVPLLQAEVLVAQSKKVGIRSAQAQAKLNQAQKVLEQARDQLTKSVEVWAALAALAEIRQQPDQAVQILQEAQQKLGDSGKLRRAQIQLWVRRGGAEAKTGLAQAAQGIDRLPDDDQTGVIADLAEAHYRLGQFTEAEQLWQQLAARPGNRSNSRLRLLLFEVALQNNRDTTMQQTIADLKRIEGNTGVLWRYCSAARLIGQARRGEGKAKLAEARGLLDAVAIQRPTWPAVFIAKAEIDDINGITGQAIANYRRAIELGDRNPRVVRQLVQQLYKQQRYAEAEQELQKLQQQAPSSDVQRLIVDILLRRQDSERAVTQAFDVVAADSTDYRDHLWLGQVLADSGQRAAQAEQHLRRAVELGPDKPETWLGLVQFLARAKKTQEAEATIAQAQAKLPADQAAMALAFCYEILGQVEKAQAWYQKALDAKPDDVFTLRSIAGFYLRLGRMTEAEPLLRKIIDGKAQSTAADRGWAPRGLALGLASFKDYRRVSDALALVGLQLNAEGKIVAVPQHSTDDAVDEVRAQVRVLARQLVRREFRQKAITLLEELAKQQKLADDDQFLLAQFYEADGSWPKARELLRELSVNGKNPVHLAFYARGAIRGNELTEARRCIGQLEQLEKERKLDAGTFGSVELRAQLLEAQNEAPKAIALLVDYANRPQSGPDRAFILLQTLVRQKRYIQALELCEHIRASHPPERVASATVSILRTMQASPAQCQGVAVWIKEMMAQNPRSTLLPLQLAELADLQGRYDEAEQAYRAVLQIDPDNVFALNNLAWFLAPKPDKAAEALVHINRAIELIGPQPDLLDTRAVVYLAQNRPALAIADLEAANADRPAPTRYFHLAQAQRQANNAQAAADIMKKATAAGLRAEHLHPVERPAFTKLLNEVEQR